MIARPRAFAVGAALLYAAALNASFLVSDLSDRGHDVLRTTRVDGAEGTTNRASWPKARTAASGDGRADGPSTGDTSRARREGVGNGADRSRRASDGVADALLAALTGVALPGTAAALGMTLLIRRRLGAIGSIAAAVAAGRTDARVAATPGGDEFDALGRAFNAVLDRSTALEDQLRCAASDLAHELRTPLGKVRAALEDAVGETVSYRVGPLVERAIDRIDELSALFASLLRIAEVERGGVDAPTAPLDVASLARDMFEAYAPAVEDSGRTLELSAPESAQTRGDRLLVAQAVSNLLDNAVLHTPAGTRISILVTEGAHDVRVSVVDDGPGVPAADLSRIVERFVRLDRHVARPGHGLGLNMVAAVARACGGKFETADAGPGLAAIMILPT